MKKLHNSCLLVLALLASNTVGAQVPQVLAQKLENTLDSMRQVTGAQSLSGAIQFGDGTVWAGAKGISSVAPPANVTPGDAYLIGSVTKSITTACVMQLADSGILKITDSLYQWLDTMQYIDPSITIRQLLNHTSGIAEVLAHPHHQDSMLADISRRWTPEELISTFIMPPNFAPGTQWAYCNTNYMLLDMIIKKATGNRFYQEYRRRFFTPLGLNSFTSLAYEPLTTPVAHVWLDITGDGIEDDADAFYMNYMSLNSSAGAAGSYFATASDCTKWMRSYMRGDIHSPTALASIKTTVFAPGSQGGLYGLGIMKNNFLGLEAWGHGGDLAYHASSWYFPLKDASISVLTNDNSVNSWVLLDVVRELLRTYNTYQLTGISSPDGLTTSWNAYPNPFTDKLTIHFETRDNIQPVRVTLQNMLGIEIAAKMVDGGSGKHTVVFDELQSLPAGTWLVTVRVGDKIVKTHTFVKW